MYFALLLGQLDNPSLKSIKIEPVFTFYRFGVGFIRAFQSGMDASEKRITH